ncbi:Murein DD-endopeptidase MepM and murein hydrolase activator NlpD, contain LysM domain [Solimonas aquatica]|uniref:Murein DD-endopeptidase MepM and murein hydrolase activator NlpD, contain LysM domain n=1 Tax=Solimonas aquatica TaxID=489703 RepID=A0A1H9CIB9_9GAMM|nr:M23 family metallopeptidase [Solimonas aquatica]SEQ00942.1 Murein DD-endopeptidase MepM and murein hydrolase activator NlpD, contain LysM domain [Solimonas aquatica]
MRGLRAALLGLLFTAAAAAQPSLPEPVQLRGDWQQSALLLGQAPAGTQVWFESRKLRVSPSGAFVFGLDRDAPAQALLRVQLPGQAAQDYRFDVERREYDIQRIEGLPPKFVSPPPEVQARIKAEQQKLGAARARDSEIDGFAQSFAWPATGRISGVFGSQRILNGTPKQPHYGLDVAVPIGTEVRAPADGVIALAETDLYFTGGTLVIDHGHGLNSIMVHLSRLIAQPGQRVKQGELVALSGMTGRATGPHLHWGVYWFNTRLDPQRLVPAQAPAAP